MKYDVVIIGSGLGGLACGVLLSKAGRSVLVLERQMQPGGCLQSYRRGDFWHDTGLHYVGGLAERQPLHEAFSLLGLLQLPWQRLDADGFDRVTIGRQTFCYAEGYDCFAETLSEKFPKEKDSLVNYVKMLSSVGQTDVMKLMSTNAYDYLIHTFHDPLLVNVLSATAMRMELRRESLPLFTFAHGQSSYIQSSWRLRGSGNQLVQTLVRQIRDAGGEVICNAEVEELQPSGGRIASAKCRNGETYYGRLFISDIHPQLTFQLIKTGQLLKPLYLKRMNELENTFGLFTVSLVLKPNVLPYFNHNKYVYRKPNVWTFWQDVGGIGGVMVSCRVPEDGGAFARQIDLLTPVTNTIYQRWDNTYVGYRGKDYQELKERLADECIQLAERVIPDLSKMVAERYTSTPLTYRDYTLTPFGSAFGLRKDSRQPLLTLLSPRTPIPNLLLTGQSLMMHGVEGVTMTALNTVDAAMNSDNL